ncbi:MAG: hypothetical protein NBV65_03710 [Burkholderiaceae bacterium]|nr:hypothetical protein [Burkholderiaceae bacterium]
MNSVGVQLSPAARTTVASVMGHSVVREQRRQPPAIKQVPNQSNEGRRECANEIEALQKLIQNSMPPEKEKSGSMVIRVRGSELVSEGQARAAGFRVVQHGRAGHCVILHFGQLHQVEIPGLLASEGAPYKMGSQLKSKVVQCQRKIFDELLNSGIKHVFSEGLEQTLVPDKFEAGSANASARDKIRACFSGYRPGDAISPGLENLLYAGGCLIYGHLVPGVTLHATITPSQVAKHDAYYNNAASRARFIANKFSVPPEDRHLFFEEVEQILMAKMKQVMQGKSLSVALAFGRDHSVERLASHYKGGEFSPAIYSKDATV